jgi:putative transposase
MTPAVVHYGEAGVIHAARERILAEAYCAHPERFRNGRPTPPQLPTAAWINRPADEEQLMAAH